MADELNPLAAPTPVPAPVAGGLQAPTTPEGQAQPDQTQLPVELKQLILRPTFQALPAQEQMAAFTASLRNFHPDMNQMPPSEQIRIAGSLLAKNSPNPSFAANLLHYVPVIGGFLRGQEDFEAGLKARPLTRLLTAGIEPESGVGQGAQEAFRDIVEFGGAFGVAKALTPVMDYVAGKIVGTSGEALLEALGEGAGLTRGGLSTGVGRTLGGSTEGVVVGRGQKVAGVLDDFVRRQKLANIGVDIGGGMAFGAVSAAERAAKGEPQQPLEDFVATPLGAAALGHIIMGIPRTMRKFGERAGGQAFTKLSQMQPERLAELEADSGKVVEALRRASGGNWNRERASEVAYAAAVKTLRGDEFDNTVRDVVRSALLREPEVLGTELGQRILRLQRDRLIQPLVETVEGAKNVRFQFSPLVNDTERGFRIGDSKWEEISNPKRFNEIRDMIARGEIWPEAAQGSKKLLSRLGLADRPAAEFGPPAPVDPMGGLQAIAPPRKYRSFSPSGVQLERAFVDDPFLKNVPDNLDDIVLEDSPAEQIMRAVDAESSFDLPIPPRTPAAPADPSAPVEPVGVPQAPKTPLTNLGTLRAVEEEQAMLGNLKLRVSHNETMEELEQQAEEKLYQEMRAEGRRETITPEHEKKLRREAAKQASGIAEDPEALKAFVGVDDETYAQMVLERAGMVSDELDGLVAHPSSGATDPSFKAAPPLGDGPSAATPSWVKETIDRSINQAERLGVADQITELSQTMVARDVVRAINNPAVDVDMVRAVRAGRGISALDLTDDEAVRAASAQVRAETARTLDEAHSTASAEANLTPPKGAIVQFDLAGRPTLAKVTKDADALGRTTIETADGEVITARLQDMSDLPLVDMRAPFEPFANLPPGGPGEAPVGSALNYGGTVDEPDIPMEMILIPGRQFSRSFRDVRAGPNRRVRFEGASPISRFFFEITEVRGDRTVVRGTIFPDYIMEVPTANLAEGFRRGELKLRESPVGLDTLLEQIDQDMKTMTREFGPQTKVGELSAQAAKRLEDIGMVNEAIAERLRVSDNLWQQKASRTKSASPGETEIKVQKKRKAREEAPEEAKTKGGNEFVKGCPPGTQPFPHVGNLDKLIGGK